MTRPIGVLPTSSAPAYAKCSLQRSWRGWKSPDEVVGGILVSGDVRTLAPVAVQASQGKIVDGSGTPMLARDDVVDVTRQRIDGRR